MVSDCAWYSCFTYNGNLIEKQFYKRLSAARRQKKKSRRTAERFSRAYDAAALIFRAAVSFCLSEIFDDLNAKQPARRPVGGYRRVTFIFAQFA